MSAPLRSDTAQEVADRKLAQGDRALSVAFSNSPMVAKLPTVTAGGDNSEAGRDLAVAELRRQQVEAAVQTWSGQLIDLGGRNQLLRYRDLKVGTLDLAHAHPEAVDAWLDGRTMSFVPAV